MGLLPQLSVSPAVLLHGFPSSSHMFRNIISLLSTKYHLNAPNLHGYRSTVAPEEGSYQYSFASLTRTVEAFIDTLKISRLADCRFDYGSPIAPQLALDCIESITAIIVQNGIAYDEGFGAEFQASIPTCSKSNNREGREELRVTALTFGLAKWQDTLGSPQMISLLRRTTSMPC